MQLYINRRIDALLRKTVDQLTSRDLALLKLKIRFFRRRTRFHLWRLSYLRALVLLARMQVARLDRTPGRARSVCPLLGVLILTAICGG